MTNEFTKEIENTVIEQKKDSIERRRYMSIQQELQRNQKEWLDKGIEQGIKKGIEQGVKQAKRDAAIGFYKKGLPISDIAEVLDFVN